MIPANDGLANGKEHGHEMKTRTVQGCIGAYIIKMLRSF